MCGVSAIPVRGGRDGPRPVARGRFGEDQPSQSWAHLCRGLGPEICAHGVHQEEGVIGGRVNPVRVVRIAYACHPSDSTTGGLRMSASFHASRANLLSHSAASAIRRLRYRVGAGDAIASCTAENSRTHLARRPRRPKAGSVPRPAQRLVCLQLCRESARRKKFKLDAGPPHQLNRVSSPGDNVASPSLGQGSARAEEPDSRVRRAARSGRSRPPSRWRRRKPSAGGCCWWWETRDAPGAEPSILVLLARSGVDLAWEEAEETSREDPQGRARGLLVSGRRRAVPTG